MTKWAKETMKKELVDAVFILPDDTAGGTITTTKVSIKSGHASVATVRGKKRYIYDFNLKLEWKLVTKSGDEANGSIRFPDIATGDDESFEATEFTVSSTDEESLRPLLQQHCYKSGWREVVHEGIHDWVQLFKETY